MVEAELKEISFTVLCDCGRSFTTEGFEGECPWCGRTYYIKIRGSREKVEVTIESVGIAPLENYTSHLTHKPYSQNSPESP